MISDTQREAFEAIKAKMPQVDGDVLALIVEAPRTVDEIVAIMGRVRNTVAPACTRLRAAQLIRDSGERRPTPAGRRAIVWEPI